MPSPSSYVTAQVLVPAVNGHLRSSSAATFRTFQRPPYAVTHIQAMAAVNTINDDEELVRGLEVQSHQSGYILRITGQDVVVANDGSQNYRVQPFINGSTDECRVADGCNDEMPAA